MRNAVAGWSRRKILLVVAFSAAVAVTSVAALMRWETMPDVTYWRLVLRILIGLEVGYGLVVAAILIGLPALTTIVLLGRRRGRRRPLAARGLLLCVTLVFGLGLCEVAATVVRPRSPLPAEPSPKESSPITPILDVGDVKLPTSFPEPSVEGETDIVVLGESSAQGVPYNFWVSMGRLVAWQLEQAIPGRRFRPFVLAAAGHTLEAQHKMLIDHPRRPGMVIVYCGHNEISARYHADREPAYYHDPDTPSTWKRFVDWVERTSPLCRLIQAAADNCRVGIPPPQGGNRVLVDVPAITPGERDAVVADFARRLEAIVAWTERVGAIPVLIFPPGSDADFEPNRSYLPPGTSRPERAAFASEFLATRRIEEKQPEEALRRYRLLADRAPGFAEIHYRIGRLLQRSGDIEGARVQDRLARDADGMPMRAQTVIGDVYRAVAARHGCILIDGPDEFCRISPTGLIDDHLMHDGMHPSLRGMIALAQSVLVAIRDRRFFGWPESTPAPIIDPAVVATKFHIGRGEWVRVCWWGIMFYELTGPGRYESSERSAKQDAFGKAADRIEAGAAPESVGLPNIGVPAAVPIVPSSRR